MPPIVDLIAIYDVAAATIITTICVDVAVAIDNVVAAGKGPQISRAICVSAIDFYRTSLLRSRRSLCNGFRQKSPIV